jgi:hypothetical protein
MPRRWKPPKEERTDADSDAVRREREFQQDLGDILEYGTEDDFVCNVEDPQAGYWAGRVEDADYAVSRFHPREARTLLAS